MTPELTCTTCRDLLPDYVAGTLDSPTAASVARHLVVCTDCLAELAIWQELDAALHRRDARLPGDAAAVAGWRALHAQITSAGAMPLVVAAPTPLHEMSIAAMNDTHTTTPPAPAPRRAPWVAAIAAVLIAVLGIAIFAVFAQRGPHKGIATSAPPTATPVPPTPVPANIPIDPTTGLPKTGGINDLVMDGPDDGWAVGGVDADKNGKPAAYTLHYDGTRWQVMGPSFPNALLNTISIAAPGDVWAGGAYAQDSTSLVFTGQLVIHFYNGVWHKVTLPGMGYPYNITMLSATTGWANGLDTDPTKLSSKPVLLRYQQGTWSPVALPAGISDPQFAMFAPDEGWMGSDQGFWHYQGGTWHLTQPETHINFASIAMSGPDDGWAGGTIPTQGGGGDHTLSGNTRYGVPASSIGNVAPFLMHYDGTAWHSVPVPSALNAAHGVIDRITMESATDGWMQAENGDGTQFVLHYDGHTWTSTNFPKTLQFFAAISGVNPNDAWASGAKIDPAATTFTHGLPLLPVLLHYTDGAWQVYTQP
jgi:hypothetical protein